MHLSICVQTQPLLEEGEQLESSFSWRVKSLWLAGTLWLHVLIVQSCPTFCDPMDCSLPGFPVHGDSPGKNHGVGCLALLQGIFSTEGSNVVLKAIYILYKTCGFSTKHSPTTQNFSDLCMSACPQLSTVRLSQYPICSRISA